MAIIRRTSKQRRAVRVRSRIVGTAERPRISVYRSSKYIYVQAIDDIAKKTIVAASEKVIEKEAKTTKSDRAFVVGKKLAEQLIEKKIKAGIFDRGSFAYNGRIKRLAEGLREVGLQI